MGIESKIGTPNGLENVANLKIALTGERLDAAHIKNNLDLLLKEITRVGGNVKKLGITAEDLKGIEAKLIAKAQFLGTNFPVELAQKLHEISEKQEKPTAAGDQSGPNNEPSIRLVRANETAKINAEYKILKTKLEAGIKFTPKELNTLLTLQPKPGFPEAFLGELTRAEEDALDIEMDEARNAQANERNNTYQQAA